ncbi:MAG: caspase family protein [Parvibaculaceae bacterium]
MDVIWRLAAQALLATCMMACAAFPASAEDKQALRGVAMVVGNSDYKHLPALANPANDARAVEMLLSALGFQTELASDRDARRMQRDLDIFVEDAAGADVAILYFAGHGIEAGGENFLVPVDADLSALDAASERLIPLSKYVRELQKTVPVTIVLLDACRTNPFPADAMVRLDAGAAPVAMAPGGLGGSRSATPLDDGAPGDGEPVQNLGTVISFSAEPGAVALDGPAGQNSPYAAAILRHLDTMAGEEFGTVMRMVAEEVFLKTAGQQRPWINESLRRLLYFGKPVQPAAGVEGRILTERRKLLITISELPMQGRRLVERVAGDSAVPMDGLFAMLSALGEKLPDDPKQLDALLRRLADDLKQRLEERRQMLEERAALRATDPEITRLLALAVQATGEGALTTAVSLWEQAKARVGELKVQTIDSIEEDLRQRRVEFASVYAGAGNAKVLALEHLGAAADFEQAAREVSRWDEALERSYLLRQAQALADHGSIRGDTPALEKAVALLEHLQGRAADDDAFARSAKLALADALSALGDRQTSSDMLRRSVAAYRELLDAPGFPATFDRGAILRRLAGGLASIGRREVGTARLEEAAGVLEQALTLEPRGTAPLLWASIQMDLGQIRADLWERGRDDEGVLAQSAAHFRAALEELDEDRSPALWATAELGLARMLRAEASDGGERAALALAGSLGAADAALRVCRREAYPVCWASAHHARAVALYLQGERETDKTRLFSLFRQSMDAFGEALEEKRLDMSPIDWAETYGSRADMLKKFADSSAAGIRVIYMAEAVRAYRQALGAINARDLPALWQSFHSSIADILTELAYTDDRLEKAAKYRRDALHHRREAMSGVSREADPLTWAARKLALAETERLVAVNGSPPDESLLVQATADLHEAIEVAGRTGAVAARAYSALGSILKLWSGDPLKLAEARQAYLDAWSSDRAYRGGFPGSSLQNNIASIDRSLAKIAAERLDAAVREIEARNARGRSLPAEARLRDRIALAVLLKAQAKVLKNPALAVAGADAFAAAAAAGTSSLQTGWLCLERAAALQDKAYLTDDTADHRAAADAYAQAMDALPAADASQAYSSAAVTRAKILGDILAPREDPAGNYKAAVAAYREALAHVQQDDYGTEAETLNWEMADAALKAAEYGAGPDYAKTAAGWYAVRIAEIEPSSGYYAPNQDKLGRALSMVAQDAKDPSRMREAAAAFAKAVDGYDKAGKPVEAAYVRAARARALYLLGRMALDAGAFSEAAEEARRYMSAIPRAENPLGWAWVQDYLGGSVIGKAELDGGSAAEAVAAFGQALELRPREADDLQWAYAAFNKAYAEMLDAGEDAARLEAAVDQARAALEIFARTPDPTDDAYARWGLCMGLASIAELRRDRDGAQRALDECIAARPALAVEGDRYSIAMRDRMEARARRILEQLE